MNKLPRSISAPLLAISVLAGSLIGLVVGAPGASAMAASVASAPMADIETYCFTVQSETQAGNLQYAVNTSMSVAEGTKSIDQFIRGMRTVLVTAPADIAPSWKSGISLMKQIRVAWKAVKTKRGAAGQRAANQLIAADAKLETVVGRLDAYTVASCINNPAPPVTPAPVVPPAPTVPPATSVPPASTGLLSNGPWAGTGAYLVGRDMPDTAVQGGKIVTDNSAAKCEFGYGSTSAAPVSWLPLAVVGIAELPITKSVGVAETWVHFRNCQTLTWVR
jgi:hypothetical protein